MPAAAALKKENRDLLKQRLKAERAALIQAFQEEGKPEKLLRSLRQSVDAVLTEAWVRMSAGWPSRIKRSTSEYGNSSPRP